MAYPDDSGERRSAAGPWLLLLVLGVAGYGAWRYLESLPSGEVVPAAATDPATPATDPAAVSTFAISTAADAAKPGQAKGSPQLVNGPRGGRAASASGRRMAPNAPAAGPASAGSTPPGASSSAPGAAITDAERVTSSNGPPTATTNAEIYDTASAGVKAPLLITPGANTPLLTGLRHPAGTPGIEIIINADGFVGSVRAVTKPASLAESLEYHNGLSVAKSWQFQPAERDGQPVRFKIFMPLAILRSRSVIK